MPRPFITLKVLNKDDKTVRMVATRKLKRVYHFLQAGNFKDCVFSLCVSYGGGYKNEGQYRTKKDLTHALKAFTEADLVREFM